MTSFQALQETEWVNSRLRSVFGSAFADVAALYTRLRFRHEWAMGIFRRIRRLWDSYRFPGFRPSTTVVGIFGEPAARVVTLVRRSKKRGA